MKANQTVEFLRRRDYKFIKELGQGACGKTVLLLDEEIGEQFVCKKYAPYDESARAGLFENFVREIKLLHKLNHSNVVRVFNYFLYRESLSGYILMEFVDGSDVEDYLGQFPEQIDDIFLQAIAGFGHLQGCGILHRDIRPGNLLVDKSGRLKIIDLGFGKYIRDSIDFDKSVTLNWWCDLPGEFKSGRYDFSTEVYFVGKLFERIIKDNDIRHFQFAPALNAMCKYEQGSRVASFLDIEKQTRTKKLFDVGFTDDEISAYRTFAEEVAQHVKKIGTGTKYVDDPERIETQLNEVYRRSMLEEYLPDAATLLSCLIAGTYYLQREGFPVKCLREFLKLLKASTLEGKRILLANLHTKLDARPRYSPPPPAPLIDDDDVPF